MKQKSILLLLGVACFAFVLPGCSQASSELSPTKMVSATLAPTKEPTVTMIPINEPTETLVPTKEPTATITPTDEPTETLEPTSISLPDSMLGTETIPLDELSPGIPWLDQVFPTPRNKYVLFNHRKAVFNDPLVRQAFSYAVDREAIATLYSQNLAIPIRPATVMTPSEILGRDLYGAVGIHYDPQKAKDLFVEAGFQDPADFPEITFLLTPTGGGGSDGNMDIVNAVISMWRENLGISVRIENIDNLQVYLNQLFTDSYDVALLGWFADYNDPNNFLRDPYSTNGLANYSQYSNSEFDRLVKDAAQIHEPEDRQKLYILAEDILCQQDPALIPLFFFGNPFE